LPLYPSIDEGIPNDADYIQSAQAPASDTCQVRLSNPVGGVAEPFGISYRYGKFFSPQIDLTVTLLQGVTTIKSWTHTDIPATPVTVRQVLTSGEFATITDFTDLYLRFTANQV
jgi:hypothetical protein